MKSGKKDSEHQQPSIFACYDPTMVWLSHTFIDLSFTTCRARGQCSELGRGTSMVGSKKDNFSDFWHPLTLYIVDNTPICEKQPFSHACPQWIHVRNSVTQLQYIEIHRVYLRPLGVNKLFIDQILCIW